MFVASVGQKGARSASSAQASLPSRLLLALALLVTCGAASPAYGDIVRLSNGRTMSVAVCRFDGDKVILVFHGGGELQAHRSLVIEILPDEAPPAEAAAAAVLASSPSASKPRPSEAAIRRMVDEVAAKVGLDAKLAHAVVRMESNYDPRAVSPKGAMGLMQLMPVLVRTFGLEDPFDPLTNLEVGLRHLRRLCERLGLQRGLAAYNAGEGAVAKYGGIPPYRETQRYVQRIVADLRSRP